MKKGQSGQKLLGLSIFRCLKPKSEQICFKILSSQKGIWNKKAFSDAFN